MPVPSETTVSAFRQIADGLRLQEPWQLNFSLEVEGLIFHQHETIIWRVEHIRPALISLRG